MCHNLCSDVQCLSLQADRCPPYGPGLWACLILAVLNPLWHSMQPIIVVFLKLSLPGFPAHQSGAQTSNPHLWIDILYLLEGVTSTHPPGPEGNISTPDLYGKKKSTKVFWCLPSTRHSPRCLGCVSELCLSGMFCPDGHSPPSSVIFLQPHLLACLLFFLNASLRFMCLPPLPLHLHPQKRLFVT